MSQIILASTRKQPNPDVRWDETSSDAEQTLQVDKETTPCLSEMKPWMVEIYQAYKSQQDADWDEALDDMIALDEHAFRKASPDGMESMKELD